ncbi:MAG TPA: phage major capsid protein [Polyangia bacterium]|nr:phage major capsid protein [Polyangia bacterium]
MLDRAYALLEIKNLAPDRRTFSGIASTPELDRQGDVFEPAGATFRNPIPLLYHHDQKLPIGRVSLTATPDGILFEATIPTVDEPGALKTRVDEAWHSIKAGILTGVSIGFRALEGGVDYLKSGRRISRSEICELSLVAIPANASASILTVKSLSARPPRSRSAMKLTSTEHVQALETKRAGLTDRMADIMETAAADASTLTDAAALEHDGLAVQVKSIDADLGRWRDLEKMQTAQAVAVPGLVRTPARPVITVKSNLPPGTAFIRYHCARIAAKAEGLEPTTWTARYAPHWQTTTPEVQLALKAAVAPGTATDAVWAGPLVNQNIATDFIEMMRAATIIDKIGGLYKVPFNTKIPAQTGGGTYNWVGEMKPKPVTSLTFGSVTLDWAKVAGIIVLTQELVKLSSPNAEDVVRREMVAGIAAFLDGQFINPAVAAVAGISPASITNGAPTAVATANPLADILGLIQFFVNNNISVAGVTFLMSPTNALALSFKVNSDGSPVFPGIDVTGGSYKGLKFITSQVVGSNVIALQPNLILFADDGGVTIDASTEASLQMDSAPDSPVVATSVLVSMFQMNTVALRAERFITWKKANANAVKYLTAAAYPAPAGVLQSAPGE